MVLDGLPGLYGFKYDSVTACGMPLYLYSYKLVGSTTMTKFSTIIAIHLGDWLPSIASEELLFLAIKLDTILVELL